MAREKIHDPAFEIGFFEAVLRRNPRYAEVIGLLGGLYTKAGRIADGLRMDRRLVRLQPENATAHYNLACSLALTGKKAAALRALEQSVLLGYGDFEWISHDPDLESLREEPEFLGLLDRIKAADRS